MITQILPEPGTVGTFTRIFGDHMEPLLEAAAHFRCALLLQDQARVPAPFPAYDEATWVVIIGDDPKPPETSMGPSGFHAASLVALLRAADDVSIISTEIKPAIYERQAVLAVAGFRGVIVETRVEHQDAWLSFLAMFAPGKVRGTALVSPKWRAAR